MTRLPNRLVAGLILALALLAGGGVAGESAQHALDISSLIEPAKLATLRARGANQSVEKYVAVLAEAKKAGENPA